VVLKSAADAIVELQSYGVAATADKFLDKIKQEVAESKAAVEIATGSLDTKSIERERTSRRLKAASILQQFEVEMGISKPAAAESATAPSVGSRVGEKPGP
jgi:O-methyltransferase involved in polyketide biosynthesis